MRSPHALRIQRSVTYKTKKARTNTEGNVPTVPIRVEVCIVYALGPGLTHAIRSPMGGQLDRAKKYQIERYDSSQFMHVATEKPGTRDFIMFSEEMLQRFAIGSRILLGLNRESAKAHELACLYYGDYGFRAQQIPEEGRDAVLYCTTKLGKKLLKSTLSLGDDILGQTFNIIDGMKKGNYGGKEALWEMREEARKKRIWMQGKLCQVSRRLGYDMTQEIEIPVPGWEETFRAAF